MIRHATSIAAALTLALVTAVAPATAVAGERTHVVAEGESVSAIARQHYGDFDHVELLLQYNGKSDAGIHPGERLAIPISEVHTIAPGDTWSEIADRYLGEPSAHTTIALLNGTTSETPLRVGEQVVLPAILTHRLARGETLTGLAERYYGDRAASAVLERFNGIADPRRLSTGQSIRVPLLVFRTVGPEPVEPVVSQPLPPQRRPQPKKVAEAPRRRFAAELAAASTTLADGAFDEARQQLESLSVSVAGEGTAEDRTELARLLAFVYVAFDQPEDACRAWTRAPEPSALDPDLVSPKIRRALARCTGENAPDS